MSLACAPKGLFGVLTPQANTTVEPELAALTPLGYGWINARLVSAKATIEERLVDYYDAINAGAAQFANAPIGALAVACTGASYLYGPAREDAMVARLEKRLAVPVVTAARSVLDAAKALGARRIALVSPYTASLDEASRRYWTARGLEIVAFASAYAASDSFHPIYSLDAAAAKRALAGLDGQSFDAVVMLGTGMPTLRAILDTPFLGAAPVLSCMLCLAWRTVAALDARAPTHADLQAWVRGQSWGGKERVPAL